MKREADISPCGLYRTRLRRQWDETKPLGAFIGLNPSIADAEIDDNTIRREIGFATAWGWGGFDKFNMWPLRSTDPKALWSADDPVGPEGDAVLAAIKNATYAAVVAAWGSQKHPRFTSRLARVLVLLDGVRLHCVGGTAKDGNPRHPLYLPSAATLAPWPTSERTR